MRGIALNGTGAARTSVEGKEGREGSRTSGGPRQIRLATAKGSRPSFLEHVHVLSSYSPANPARPLRSTRPGARRRQESFDQIQLLIVREEDRGHGFNAKRIGEGQRKKYRWKRRTRSAVGKSNVTTGKLYFRRVRRRSPSRVEPNRVEGILAEFTSASVDRSEPKAGAGE